MFSFLYFGRNIPINSVRHAIMRQKIINKDTLLLLFCSGESGNRRRCTSFIRYILNTPAAKRYHIFHLLIQENSCAKLKVNSAAATQNPSSAGNFPSISSSRFFLLNKKCFCRFIRSPLVPQSSLLALFSFSWEAYSLTSMSDSQEQDT